MQAFFFCGRLPDAGIPPLLDRGGSQRHHGVQPGPLQVPQEDPEAAEEPGHGPVSPLLCLRPPSGQPLNSTLSPCPSHPHTDIQRVFGQKIRNNNNLKKVTITAQTAAHTGGDSSHHVASLPTNH